MRGLLFYISNLNLITGGAADVIIRDDHIFGNFVLFRQNEPISGHFVLCRQLKSILDHAFLQVSDLVTFPPSGAVVFDDVLGRARLGWIAGCVLIAHGATGYGVVSADHGASKALGGHL